MNHSEVKSDRRTERATAIRAERRAHILESAIRTFSAKGFVRVRRWHLSNGVNAPEELEAWLPLTVPARARHAPYLPT